MAIAIEISHRQDESNSAYVDARCGTKTTCAISETNVYNIEDVTGHRQIALAVFIEVANDELRGIDAES